MRICLGLALSLMMTGSVAADPLILAQTPLGSDRCKVIKTAKADDTGARLKRSQWYASAWRCSGFAGQLPYIAYDDEREGLAFGSERAVSTEYLWHAHFGKWGPLIEWRGSAAGAAVAAIARYSWNVESDHAHAPAKKGADLAVIKVGGGKNACIIAWVDAVANPDALDLARKHADTAAAHYVCTVDKVPARLGMAGAH